MDLTVTSADDMPKEIFVKQRFALDDDVFAAIASPAQLEDLPINEPDGVTTYFRTSSVSLVAANQAALDSIYASIVAEVQQLVANLNALDVSAVPDLTCEITADAVVTQ